MARQNQLRFQTLRHGDGSEATGQQLAAEAIWQIIEKVRAAGSQQEAEYAVDAILNKRDSQLSLEGDIRTDDDLADGRQFVDLSEHFARSA